MKAFEDIHVPLRHANRIKSRSAPFSQHWCNACDANIIAVDAKCSNCGHRAPSKRLKNFEIKD